MNPIDIIRGGIVPAWKAGKVEPITWVRIKAPGGYEVFTNAESLSVGGLRSPMSFNEEIALATMGKMLPITNEIQDARYAAAPVKGIAITEDGPPKGAGETGDPDQILRFNARMGPIGKALREGEAKAWVVHENLEPGQVINRGFRRPDGSLIQQGLSISTAHNADYGIRGGAYSQQGFFIARRGFLNGKPVDMLDHLAAGGPLGKFPAWLVTRLRGAVS